MWLPPEARPRYFMPLFPCFAVLVGIAAEVLLEPGRVAPVYSSLWPEFVRCVAGLLAVTAIVLPLASGIWPASAWVMPMSQSLLVAVT